MQTSDKSWWPKELTWRKSGLNIGYWSADCERWFQNRLEAIRNNKADLKTAADWKMSLKLRRDTSRLLAANEYVAANFLDGHHFV